jgi:hypothetical protein
MHWPNSAANIPSYIINIFIGRHEVLNVFMYTVMALASLLWRHLGTDMSPKNYHMREKMYIDEWRCTTVTL